MGPATLSSGMLQINVFVSLFFASGIPAAAAGLGYANLLVQTPLGLLSNALLVPLLPVYARLTAPQDKPELIGRIRQGLRQRGVAPEKVEAGLRAALEDVSEDEVVDSLEVEARAELAQVAHALERLKEGLGDACESCGGEIDPRRLQVLPYTTLCVNCAEKLT